MPNIAIATCNGIPGMHPDDAFLRNALRLDGALAHVLAWNDPCVDWQTFDAVVVRAKRDAASVFARHIGERVTIWCAGATA